MRTLLPLLLLSSLAATTSSLAVPAYNRATDFDGDGATDVGVYYGNGNTWYILQSASQSMLQSQQGGVNSRPVLGDFDGDGRADVASVDRRTYQWTIRQSSNGQIRQVTFGSAGWRPVPADFDGDGLTDLALYKRDTGDWMILQSSDNQTRTTNWGSPEARAVPGDYDGDGRADIAVYTRRTGDWFILFSSGGSLHQNWGWAQARPVPGDYDGDGRTDLAVYHPASGNWYILNSSGGSRQQNWGWSAARPAPGDYDGDGRTDIAVYNAAAGNWYILRSASQAMLSMNWGWKEATSLPSYRDGGIMGLIILAFGDSITYGTASSTDSPLTGYPILLERKLESWLGGNFATINAGNPGESTDEGRTRILAWLQAVKPDLTLIMEGTNDMFFKVPFGTVKNNLASMCISALNTGSSVILATIPPVIKSAYRDRSGQARLIQQFNPNIYYIASALGIPVSPVYESITSVPGWQSLLIDQETANHPNDAGYLVVRDAFFGVIRPNTQNGILY